MDDESWMTWHDRAAQDLRDLAAKIEEGTVCEIGIVYTIKGEDRCYVLHASSSDAKPCAKRLARAMGEWAQEVE